MTALKLTVGISLVVVAINVVMGTIIAWVLVRDRFFGRRLRLPHQRPVAPVVVALDAQVAVVAHHDPP